MEKTLLKSMEMMPLNTRVLQLATATLLLGGLFSCGKLPQSGFGIFSNPVPVTKIGDIQQNQQSDSTVYLQGKVGSPAPMLGSGAYELQDPTGKIWVLSSEMLPVEGDEVLIQGKVQYQSIPVAGKDLGEVYLQQLQQLERTPAKKGSPILPEGSYEQ